MKVWDVAGNQPTCIQEKSMQMGLLHCGEGCPDAPFVVAFGGDKPQDNLKIMDLRESAAGRKIDIHISLG